MQFNDEGLSALIFTSEGDMRQAINNLQSTHSGFGFISADNVFKVCDQPHPVLVQATIRACVKGDVDVAMAKLTSLWDQGYSAVDIVVTFFRVVKTFDECVFLFVHFEWNADRDSVGFQSTRSLSSSRYFCVRLKYFCLLNFISRRSGSRI